MHKVIYIKPGTETLTQRLEAIQALALSAAAAEADLADANAEELQAIEADVPDGVVDPATLHAMNRLHDANEALSLEVEDLHRNGGFDFLLTVHP